MVDGYDDGRDDGRDLFDKEWSLIVVSVESRKDLKKEIVNLISFLGVCASGMSIEKSKKLFVNDVEWITCYQRHLCTRQEKKLLHWHHLSTSPT